MKGFCLGFRVESYCRCLHERFAGYIQLQLCKSDEGMILAIRWFDIEHPMAQLPFHESACFSI